MRAAGEYLVVIGDEAEQVRLGTFLHCVAVEPPHPVWVYRHRLTRRGLADTVWPHWHEAPVLLENALPADARRLSDLVEEIGRRDRRGAADGRGTRLPWLGRRTARLVQRAP